MTNFVVSEDPGLTSILSTSNQSISVPLSSTPPASGSTWTGYAPITSSYPFGEWNVPSESAPSGGCGSFFDSYCTMDLWIGVTSLDGGGNPCPGTPGCGIAQTGSEDQVHEYFGTYTNTYSSWYEFFPDNPVTCFGTSANDEVYAIVEIGSTGQYDMEFLDYTKNKYCAEVGNPPGMGPPEFANYIAENPTGGSSPPPATSQITFNALGTGQTYDLLSYQYLTFTSFAKETLGPLQYDTGPCASGGSCFTETYN